MIIEMLWGEIDEVGKGVLYLILSIDCILLGLAFRISY